MKTVFISRDIHQSSKFNLLKKRGVGLIAESMLSFESLDFDHEISSDWLLFYSANGVKFFAQQVPRLSSAIQLAAVGIKTGDVVKKYFGKVDFTGEGEAETYIDFFRNVIYEGKQLSVVRAQYSANSFLKLLGESGKVREIIPYTNRRKEVIPQIRADIYIFTSALNADAFFSVNPVNPAARYLAIGLPTAEALYLAGVQNVIISKSPDEESLWETCAAILEADSII